VTITGAVCFPGPEQAELAKTALVREGYEVNLQRQKDGSVVLATGPSSTAPTGSALTARLERLAAEFGGSFMGHGGRSSVPLRRHS
jgi:hypothetical protein